MTGNCSKQRSYAELCVISNRNVKFITLYVIISIKENVQELIKCLLQDIYLIVQPSLNESPKDTPASQSGLKCTIYLQNEISISFVFEATRA